MSLAGKQVYLIRKGPWTCQKCHKIIHTELPSMSGKDICRKCQGKNVKKT